MSKGVDIGTCFLVSAQQDDKNQIQIKSIRDAFLDMDNDPQVKSMMKMSGANFIEGNDCLYIIGDSAIVIANIFQKEARRPLSKGVIAPGELEAEKILLVLIKNILGNAKVQGETCYYSVPAPPIDHEADVTYHQAVWHKRVATFSIPPVVRFLVGLQRIIHTLPDRFPPATTKIKFNRVGLRHTIAAGTIRQHHFSLPLMRFAPVESHL